MKIALFDILDTIVGSVQRETHTQREKERKREKTSAQRLDGNVQRNDVCGW